MGWAIYLIGKEHKTYFDKILVKAFFLNKTYFGNLAKIGGCFLNETFFSCIHID